MGRNGKVGRITSHRFTNQRTIGAIAELVGVLDNVQAVAVVVAAVHPVIYIVPPALNVAILGITVSIPVSRRSASVVLHSVRLTVVLLRTTGRTAPANPLTIPVSELDQEQHSNVPHLGEVHLPNVSPQIMDTGTSRTSGDTDLLRLVGLRLVGAGGAVIPGNVGEVQFAETIAAIHVHRVHMESLNRTIRNLELQLLARLGPLVPILGLLDHHAAGTGLLDHAGPGHQIVKGRGAITVVHSRIRIAEPGRCVGAGALGGAAAGPIPFHAVDGDELCLDRNILIRRGKVVGTLGNFDFNGRSAGSIANAVDSYLTGGLVDGADGSDLGVAGGGGDSTVALPADSKLSALVSSVQRNRSGAHRNGVIALSNGPGDHLGFNRTIRPLIVGGRSERSRIGRPGIDLGLHTQRHLGGVIVGVPGRSLGVAVVLRHTALSRNLGDGGPANDPLDGLVGCGAVRPHSLQQGERSGMLPGIRSRCNRHGAVLRVKVVPLRCLSSPGIGEGAGLRRNRHDDTGDRPGGGLHTGAAVPPLIVIRRSEFGSIVAGIGSEPIAADSELAHDIPIPGGGLGGAVGGQHVALGGQSGNHRPVNDPVHRDFAGAVGEQISVDQRKLGSVSPGVDPVRRSAHRHFDGIVSVPGRRLARAVIAWRILLGGDSHFDSVDRHVQAGGFGHTFIGVRQLDSLRTKGGECGAGVGIPRDARGGAVRERGGNGHAVGVKAFQIVVDHLGRIGGNFDAHQNLFHRHRSARRLGGPALRIGDGDLSRTVGQDGGGHGVSGHIRSDAIAIASSDDHASGIKALSGFVSCLDRGFGDGQALQLEGATSATTAGQVKNLSDIGVVTHSVSTSSRRIFTVRSMSGVTSHRNMISPSFTTLSALMPVSLQSM